MCDSVASLSNQLPLLLIRDEFKECREFTNGQLKIIYYFFKVGGRNMLYFSRGGEPKNVTFSRGMFGDVNTSWECLECTIT